MSQNKERTIPFWKLRVERVKKISVNNFNHTNLNTIREQEENHIYRRKKN